MYTIKSNDTRMYNTVDRLSNGWMHDDELLPYTKKFLKNVLDYFEVIEDYEKCQIILDAINRLDHENNYHKCQSILK